MENNIDKLFREKLGDVPDFDPAAWDRMDQLLDDDRRSRRFGFWKPIFFLGVMSLIIIGGVTFLQMQTADLDTSAVVASDTSSAADNEQPLSSRSTEKNEEMKMYISTTSTNNDIRNGKDIAQVKKPEVDNYSEGTARPLAMKKMTTPNNKDVWIDRVSAGQTRSDSKDQAVSADAQSDDSRISSQQDENEKQSVLDRVGESEGAGQKKIIANNSKQLDGGAGQERSLNVNEAPDHNAQNSVDSPVGMANNTQYTDLSSQDASEENATDQQIAERSIDENYWTAQTLLADLTRQSAAVPIVPPVVRIRRQKATLVSLVTRLGVGDGGLGSFGVQVQKPIGAQWNASAGIEMGYRSFATAPELSVMGKIYSFGSTVSEKSLTVDGIGFVEVPISLHRRWGGLDMKVGFAPSYQTLLRGAKGSIGEPGSPSQWYSVDAMKPLTLNYHCGVGYRLHRRLSVGAELGYRSSIFKSANTDYSGGGMIGSIGLTYNIFKF